MPGLKAGQGRIYFLRSSSMFGAAVQPEIRLNGQVVGQSKPGGFFYVDRAAGTYSATTATETENAASFKLDSGEIKYLRTSPSMGCASTIAAGCGRERCAATSPRPYSISSRPTAGISVKWRYLGRWARSPSPAAGSLLMSSRRTARRASRSGTFSDFDRALVAARTGEYFVV